MKRTFKAAAAIGAMVLALSLFAACDDDDDSFSSYTCTYTYDFSSYTKATAASTGWDDTVDWDVESYYTDQPSNAFLIICTYETSGTSLAVYPAATDDVSGIALPSSGAGSTNALLIDSTGYTWYLGISYTSGASSFTYLPYAALTRGYLHPFGLLRRSLH